MEEFLKCECCGKQDETVQWTQCAFSIEIHDNYNDWECICAECEQQHIWDI